jgi:hypothetical protein
MNNKNKVDGLRGSLANTRDDTGFWSGGGKEAAIRRHLAFLSNILANRRFFPPMTPYIPVIPSVSEESYNQLL